MVLLNSFGICPVDLLNNMATIKPQCLELTFPLLFIYVVVYTFVIFFCQRVPNASSSGVVSAVVAKMTCGAKQQQRKERRQAVDLATIR